MRRRAALALLALALAGPAAAEMVVAARTIRAQSVIAPADLALRPGGYAGVAARPAEVVGQEALVALYPGRPIRFADLGPPALVRRNQIVTLVYATGGLDIRAEARALDRGAAGDRVRVMNLSSRASVFGEVQADGTITVSR